MIFLITAARRKWERAERRRKTAIERTERVEEGVMVEERAGRLLHLAVSTPYSSKPARPSSTRVQPRVQPRRPRGFSHKKYWSELLLGPWGSRAERVESTLTACPAFIFIIPLAPRVRRRRRRRRRLCLPSVVGLPLFFSLATLWLPPAAALATPFLPHPSYTEKSKLRFGREAIFYAVLRLEYQWVPSAPLSVSSNAPSNFN